VRQVLQKFPQLVELVAIFSIWGRFYIYLGREIGEYYGGLEIVYSCLWLGFIIPFAIAVIILFVVISVDTLKFCKNLPKRVHDWVNNLQAIRN